MLVRRFDASPSGVLTAIIALTLLHISVVAVFNYIVDPYDFFGNYLSNGANKVKTVKNFYLTKPEGFNKGTYDTVILGTSRSINLNEQSPMLDGMSTYNFSIHGSSVTQHYNNLVYSNSRQKLHTVIIGLDMMSYLALDRLSLAGSIQSKGAHHSDRYQYFLDAMSILFSKKAFADSFETLETSKQFADLSGKPGRGERILRKGGYALAFEETEKSFLERDGPWLASRFNKRVSSQAQVMESNLRVLQDMIDYCRENNIQLKLFISPVHTRLLATMEVASMWDVFTIWKTRVTEIIEKNQRDYPGLIQFEDFSLVNDLTTEPVPPRGSQQVMHWFYDGSHYSKATGEEILAVLIKGKEMPGFYDQPDSTMINEYMRNERRQVLDYMNQHPDVVATLKESFCGENPDQCR